MNYDDPRSIAAELESLGFVPQKRFGQNFMINAGARSKIVELAAIGPHETVWEIGPGLGALTKDLIAKASLLRVFEIDRGYLEFLSRQFGDQTNFRLVAGDAAKTWTEWRAEKPACIIGNLPYNVAAGLIADFLAADFVPRMVFTIQREVGQRMTAKPGDADYGSFSVLCQARCQLALPMVLRPGSFWPAPGVTSAVVVLRPRATPLDLGRSEIFDQVLRSLFAARRKTIANNLKSSPLAGRLGASLLLEAASQAGIDLGDRAENLSPETIAALSVRVSQLDQGSAS